MAEEKHFPAVVVADRIAAPAHFAGSRARKPGERAQQRRFAAAVGTAHAQQAAGLQREAQTGKKPQPAAFASELPSLKHAADFTREAACEPAAPAGGNWGIVRPMQNRWLVPFLNLGHLLDHLAMLVFPTAVVAIGREWGRPYSELLPLALGSFIAFGVFAIPAGWLADHWSRYKVL